MANANWIKFDIKLNLICNFVIVGIALERDFDAKKAYHNCSTAVDSAYFLVLFAIQTVTMKFERLFVMQKYAKLQVLSSFSCPSYKKRIMNH